ncbi:MAG TPA: ribosome-associated translation inhibitor RaiA [Tepidisphaeraceae bacterium]|nr:ribosome-associated translation inhibitor RaiA [Tepidisphaeraceae bacterium]
MTVIVTSRHMEVSPALRTYGEQKVAKLTRYYDRIQEIEIVFDAHKDAVQVEIIVHAEHRNMFIGRHNNGDAYACVDGCISKLERQLSDHKKRVRNRKHSAPDAKRELRDLGEAV